MCRGLVSMLYTPQQQRHGGNKIDQNLRCGNGVVLSGQGIDREQNCLTKGAEQSIKIGQIRFQFLVSGLVRFGIG